MKEPRKLTTKAGAPVADNQNVMTADRGPMLLQDVWFLEKLAQFDREVIPERRMHAKGSGAYGTQLKLENVRIQTASMGYMIIHISQQKGGYHV